MTAARALRVAAVLEAAGPAAARHARALGGFLRDGLEIPCGLEVEAFTHLFGDADDASGPLHTAPTREVRLVSVPPGQPDVTVGALTALQAGSGADLLVFPAGPSGTELAARLAARTGGGVLTGVLSASLTGDRLTCRRAVWAGHLTGDFALGTRPWCIVLDAGWDDARTDPPDEHDVVATTCLGPDDAATPPPLVEVEALETPPTRDLETATFLVVAGRGAGSRAGVERIAAAAARMGAAFGATRPVVMNAWAAPDRQVGVSGTRAAPDVCVVAGASGAPAFLWGVERAGFIAAVDIDDHAPIGDESDAFVVGDAVAVLEELAGLLG